MKLFNIDNKVSQWNYSARLNSVTVKLLTNIKSIMVVLHSIVVVLSIVSQWYSKSITVVLRTKTNRTYNRITLDIRPMFSKLEKTLTTKTTNKLNRLNNQFVRVIFGRRADHARARGML